MNVFYEFYKIVQHLQAESVDYALIGGVALAFHSQPRFTKDVDILIPAGELEKVSELLKREKYFESASPWTFKSTGLTLHRFLKVEDADEMIVDILIANDEDNLKVIENALEAESEGIGVVKLATKEDLISLKSKRNSLQDQADIARLRDEES